MKPSIDKTRVSSVEKLDSRGGFVYDMGVEDTPHCFFGNGVLVSNSVFYSAVPLVKNRESDVDTEDEKAMTEHILDIADEVQEFINDSYNFYSDRLLNSGKDDHWLEIKQEMIARSGLWIRKKRYAQWIINDEGDPVQKPDWKGIEIVRSDFPRAFKEHLREVLIEMLNQKPKEKIDEIILDFKNSIHETDLDLIANPTGVNNIGKYDSKNRSVGTYHKYTPIHVKSSMNYNDLIDIFGLVANPIRSGTKIKWVYLLNNPYGFTEIAYTGQDDPDKIMEFIENHVDYSKMYEKVESALDTVYSARGWALPTKSSSVMTNLFG